MRYSVIVPVYNRPQEVAELLDSLAGQQVKDFEVVVVEDGSTLPCKQAVNAYKDALSLSYYAKPNTGPGESRNYGAAKSRGDYLIVLDSDCIAPPHYFEEVEKELNANPCDAFGGPDAAHHSFSAMQKAVNYAMTSFLTTGGIRGGKKQLETFHPRSFNMGVKREVYAALGGFSSMRYGEDIDFSIRIFESGYKARLFPRAFVFHKRRTNLRKFFLQVYHSGAARIDLALLHKGSLKAVHALPALFLLGGAGVVAAAAFFSPWVLALPALYAALLFADALAKTRQLKTALLSVLAAGVQLTGYGWGFLQACVLKIILRQGPESNEKLSKIYK